MVYTGFGFLQGSGFYRVRFWQASLYLLDILIIAKWNLYLMRNMHNSIHMVVCFSAVFSFVVDLRSVEYITLKLKMKTNLIKIRHWIAICSPPPPPFLICRDRWTTYQKRGIQDLFLIGLNEKKTHIHVHQCYSKAYISLYSLYNNIQIICSF